MVKLEGLTEKEIEMRDIRRKYQREADEGNRRFAQLSGRLLRITEEMFDAPFYDFLWGKSVVGRNYVVKNGGVYTGSYYYTVRIERKFMTSSIQAKRVLVYGVLGHEGMYMNVHNPSENRIMVGRQNNLNDALKLARTYEEAGFGEFTVKKQYEE